VLVAVGAGDEASLGAGVGAGVSGGGVGGGGGGTTIGAGATIVTAVGLTLVRVTV
jgi:hypothetical protein